MEGFIIILGMCLTCIPVLIFVNYLFEHIKEKAKFDEHLQKIKEQNSILAISIAYLNKLSLGIAITTTGIFMSTYFQNTYALKISIAMYLVYLVAQYLDKEK